MQFHKIKSIGATVFCLWSFSVAAQVDTSYFSNLKYRSLGPARGGRSAAVTGDLNNRDLFYMGTTGGGVWKTENGGHSWKNISDGFFGGSIGSISIAPSDDNVIYVGQGEETLRGNVSSGNGVWKSVDAGETWTFKGLKNGRHITRIAIHPTNPDIAFAAVLGDLYIDSDKRGLYRTNDGGNTWEKVLFSSGKAGFNEVVIDPLNHRVVYASAWQVRRTPYDFSSGGEGSGIWKSKDGGSTWKRLDSSNGLPAGILGKITISASRVQKNLVFAMVEHKTRGGLYKSVDGGENWRLMNSEGKIRQRAWYFSRIYCDTKDASTVYTMNVRFQKSTDGGLSFSSVSTPHVDHHDLWIDPNDPNRMIVANDGGGQVSYNGGKSWSSYHNQPTEQFYRVTTDQHVPYRIYGAQQDNSTMRVNHMTGQYEVTAGGESAHIAVSPDDDDLVFAGSYGGYLTMYNHRTHDSRAINVWPDNPMGYGAEGMKYRFQWNFPLFFSPHNSFKLYAASNHLHVSYNNGESWSIISPDLTRNDSTKMVSSGGPITKDNTGVEYYCTIFAAAESALEEGVIWVGSDDGLIHITRDSGNEWKNITPKKLPEWTMINCIEPDPFEKDAAYVVATGYKNGDNKPYIIRMSSYGENAEFRVAGIPDNEFVRVVRADKKVKGLLYAGTEKGMYISYNHGLTWQTFQLNLPKVPVTDLTQPENDLVVATQGRGFWIIDNLDAVRLARPLKLNDPVKVVGVENAYLIHGDKATLTYYIKDTLSEKDTLFIDIIGPKGEVVKTYSNIHFSEDTIKIEPKIGMNYQHWWMRYPGAQKPKEMILWWANTAGPMAAPGEYSFRLKLNDFSGKTSFLLEIDPNSDAIEEDYVARFEFLNESISKLDETHEAIEEMQLVEAQLDYFESHHTLNKEDTIIKTLNLIKEELDRITNDLYQTKNRSEQDPINFPIKLNNKLAHLNSLVSMGNFGPTDQAIKVKEELVAAINQRLADFEKLKQNDLARFNTMLLEREIPLIEVE